MNQVPGNAQLQAKISKKLKEYGIVLADGTSTSRSKGVTKASHESKLNSTKPKTPRK